MYYILYQFMRWRSCWRRRFLRSMFSVLQWWRRSSFGISEFVSDVRQEAGGSHRFVFMLLMWVMAFCYVTVLFVLGAIDMIERIR